MFEIVSSWWRKVNFRIKLWNDQNKKSFSCYQKQWKVSQDHLLLCLRLRRFIFNAFYENWNLKRLFPSCVFWYWDNFRSWKWKRKEKKKFCRIDEAPLMAGTFSCSNEKRKKGKQSFSGLKFANDFLMEVVSAEGEIWFSSRSFLILKASWKGLLATKIKKGKLGSVVMVLLPFSTQVSTQSLTVDSSETYFCEVKKEILYQARNAAHKLIINNEIQGIEAE